MTTEVPFVGAKLAVLARGGVLTLQRDDYDHIPYPGMWDLPGGGREDGETGIACALRETEEELGLVLPPEVISWGRMFPHALSPGQVWFYVARIEDLDLSEITLGDEGQGWRLMPVDEFLAHDNAVPQLQDRLRVYLQENPA